MWWYQVSIYRERPWRKVCGDVGTSLHAIKRWWRMSSRQTLSTHGRVQLTCTPDQSHCKLAPPRTASYNSGIAVRAPNWDIRRPRYCRIYKAWPHNFNPIQTSNPELICYLNSASYPLCWRFIIFWSWMLHWFNQQSKFLGKLLPYDGSSVIRLLGTVLLTSQRTPQRPMWSSTGSIPPQVKRRSKPSRYMSWLG